jgi:hypothetical protein
VACRRSESRSSRTPAIAGDQSADPASPSAVATTLTHTRVTGAGLCGLTDPRVELDFAREGRPIQWYCSVDVCSRRRPRLHGQNAWTWAPSTFLTSPVIPARKERREIFVPGARSKTDSTSG